MNSFEEKELSILRHAVDKIQSHEKKKIVNSSEVKEIIQIVEEFIKSKELICYGGTAINNILPDNDQFYDKSMEIPDYDFFSTNALAHAKKLADKYAEAGYEEVEAKSGIHVGTFKVFVNFIPVADVTQLPTEIFKNLKDESIVVDNICYASPLFLRMSMYLELSRPRGDVSRWEKILNRLILLNKHYPMKSYNCSHKKIRRDFSQNPSKQKTFIIYECVRNAFIRDGVVFFGSFAFSLYSKHMPSYLHDIHKKYVDFDVLSTSPEKTAAYVKNQIDMCGIKNCKIVAHTGVGDLVAPHLEIKIKNETIAFIYKSTACHSYNEIMVERQKIKVASIDTILQLYLAFIFTDKPYYDKERLLCLAQFLFVLQQKNRLKQSGLLKRFSETCLGEQETLEIMRSKKTHKFKTLKRAKKTSTVEFETWFLRYMPKTRKKNVN